MGRLHHEATVVFGAGAAVPVCRGLPLRTLAPRGTWAQAQRRGAGLVLSANAGRMVGAFADSTFVTAHSQFSCHLLSLHPLHLASDEKSLELEGLLLFFFFLRMLPAATPFWGHWASCWLRPPVSLVCKMGPDKAYNNEPSTKFSGDDRSGPTEAIW